MPPSADDRLRDILSAIEKIERATSGMNVTEFADNEIVRAATERFLGVVCESSLRLPDSIKQQATGIDWRNMNDFAICFAMPITRQRSMPFGISSKITCRL